MLPVTPASPCTTWMVARVVSVPVRFRWMVVLRDAPRFSAIVTFSVLPLRSRVSHVSLQEAVHSTFDVTAMLCTDDAAFAEMLVADGVSTMAACCWFTAICLSMPISAAVRLSTPTRASSTDVFSCAVSATSTFWLPCLGATVSHEGSPSMFHARFCAFTGSVAVRLSLAPKFTEVVFTVSDFGVMPSTMSPDSSLSEQPASAIAAPIMLIAVFLFIILSSRFLVRNSHRLRCGGFRR